MEDLKGKTILISSAANTRLLALAESQVRPSPIRQTRPYTFNIQPFMADKNVVQQGYLSSEPYAIEKEAGVQANTSSCFRPRLPRLQHHHRPAWKRPSAKTQHRGGNFVKASMEGWKSYLRGDPAPANALIKKDNPNMTDDKIAHGIKLLNETGMVFGGDAATLGAGVITDARMQKTFDMMVAMKLIDPAKVDVKKTYTTQFVKDLRVLP
jgi:NitT/TauT family transport system substrate-binding protein